MGICIVESFCSVLVPFLEVFCFGNCFFYFGICFFYFGICFFCFCIVQVTCKRIYSYSHPILTQVYSYLSLFELPRFKLQVPKGNEKLERVYKTCNAVLIQIGHE